MAVTDPTNSATANSAQTDTDRLSCGRHIDDIWDHINTPADAHEQNCPYCRDARASLTTLATATRELSAADRADPSLHASPQVLTNILTVARAEVRRGRRIPLEQSPSTDSELTARELTVSEQTLADAIRRIADSVDGVNARRSTVKLATTSPGDGTTAGSAPLESPDKSSVEITVDLQISAATGLAIPDLSRGLRSRIRTAVEQQVGIVVTAVNISVEDVHD